MMSRGKIIKVKNNFEKLRGKLASKQKKGTRSCSTNTVNQTVSYFEYLMELKDHLQYLQLFPLIVTGFLQCNKKKRNVILGIHLLYHEYYRYKTNSKSPLNDSHLL